MLILLYFVVNQIISVRHFLQIGRKKSMVNLSLRSLIFHHIFLKKFSGICIVEK
ncbi:hypothetical protein C1645_779766 [Glomus cerebriforme]|uniref:Uncharacterized protein n=1 Tax=Glomus cerebriforme TaxID=658196 RepID=A0A397SL65_9GLOM|nr:hypothetical protein C1645_779766 [Glomus cerebriforme]